MKLLQTILLLTLLGLSYADILEKLEIGLFGSKTDLTFPLIASDCRCRLRASSRVVNGQIADEHFIPWQVSLADYGNQHFCGGTILSAKHILTAAHCVREIKPTNIRVRVGIHYLTERTSDLEDKTYPVEKTFSNSRSGLAILRLSKPFQFNPGKIEPACLSLVEKNFMGLELMAGGWGVTTQMHRDLSSQRLTHIGKRSDVLKIAFFQEYKKSCDKTKICVESPKRENPDSLCRGDSGASLNYINPSNGKTTVEGVAINIRGIRDAYDYIHCTGKAEFARLANSRKWITNIIGKNYCQA